MEKNKMIIGLVGLPGSGKSTVAGYLNKKGFTQIILSDFIKKELQKQGITETNRRILQKHGNLMREKFGSQILTKLAYKQIVENKLNQVVIDGIRNLSEVKYLQKFKEFTLIGVICDQKIRYQRLVKKRGKKYVGSFNEFIKDEQRESELGSNINGLRVEYCLEQAKYLLDNFTSISELYQAVDRIIQTIINQSKKSYLQIAIDGSAASGKSTLAKKLAQKFNLNYIYTGGMYRALAWVCLQNKVDFNNNSQIIRELNQNQIELTDIKPGNPDCRVMVNGQDITKLINRLEVSEVVPLVAKVPQVREKFIQMQKQLVKNRSVVVEGRDIGYNILPFANFKIYLSGNINKIAKSRHLDYKQENHSHNFRRTLIEMKKRDLLDKGRNIDPLKKLPEAWEIDISDKKPEELLKEVLDLINKRRLL